MVTLADDIIVLLVLVVRSIGFNDLSHPVNRARNAVSSNEVGEIPLKLSAWLLYSFKEYDLLV